MVLSEGTHTPDEAHLKTYLDHGFKEVVLPAVDHAVLTTFPFNNTVSIFIAVARVYPKLAEYIKVRFIGGCYFNKFLKLNYRRAPYVLTL